MNCAAPFPDDDPFLPRQDAPHGPCDQCGMQHRLDLGCPVSEGDRSAQLLAYVVACILCAVVMAAAVVRSLGVP